MLLPTGHPLIRVEPDDREVRVPSAERRWVFPRGDCLLLPIPNTTAELLARHIGRRLLDDLHARSGVRLALVRVEVDQCSASSPSASFAESDPSRRGSPRWGL